MRAETGRGWGGLGGACARLGRTTLVAANRGGDGAQTVAGMVDLGLGFGGERASRARITRGRGGGADSAWIRTHAERRLLVRGTRLAAGGGDACGAEQSRGKEKGRLTGGLGRGKK